MNLLVAVANHGNKNRKYLEVLLQEYRSMPFRVQVVVLSDIPKDLASDIEVRLGCPTRDPWSLPFGHKRLFAERADQYDLFIYSEDDTLIKAENIQAFLKVTAALPEDRLAGFMRYEVDGSGKRHYSTAHSHFHWIPDSVETFGGYTFARFTNDHSACYLLTQRQLKRAIRSGGFLVEPHQERYDLLVSAATDPYTQCGFKKVICISHFEDFVLPHLPNQYVGNLGLNSADFQLQIQALLNLQGNGTSREQLFQTQTNLKQGRWSRNYYEPPRDDILRAIPAETRTLLSVGCGWGEMERKLVERKVRVSGIPLDAVIGACAEARGVRLTSPDFAGAFASLGRQRFDCVLISDVLQYLADPLPVLSAAAVRLAPRGVLVVSAPDFNVFKIGREVWRGSISLREKRNFEAGGMHFTNQRMVERWLRQCGLEVMRLKAPGKGSIGLSREALKKRFASDLVLSARKKEA